MDDQKYFLASAFDAEGLQRSFPSFSTVGAAASSANGIGQCDPPSCEFGKTKPKIYLTVDYSRSSLTLISWVEDDTIIDYFDCLHDVNLGADALANRLASEEDYWASVRRLVERAASLSDLLSGYYKNIVPKVVSQVVFLGDRVMNRQLLDILRDVLGLSLISEANPGDGGRAGLVDPVFAAARGVAAGAKRIIDHGDWYCEAPGYCDEERVTGKTEL